MKTQDQLFAEITVTVNQINAAEASLTALRERLREQMAKWAGKDVAIVSQDKPKRAKRKTGAPGVNIAEAVRALVRRQTGLNVPQIMDKLGLRGHEAAVRSALKKDKDKVLVSVDGRWYPIAADPALQPPAQKEKAPDVTPEPGRYVEPYPNAMP